MSPQLTETPAPTSSPELGLDDRDPVRVERSASRVAMAPRTYWRRRGMVVLALLAIAFLATGLIGRVGAEAELEDKVAGHVVVQPGETLWDVAADTAPTGTDTREHLGAVRELNDLDGSHVEAWTVVLIPAR